MSDDVTVSAYNTSGPFPSPILILHPDGTLELGPGVKPDEAARVFYAELERTHQLAWRTVEAEICERRGHQVVSGACRWCHVEVRSNFMT